MAGQNITDTEEVRTAGGKTYVLPKGYADEFNAHFEQSEDEKEFNTFWEEMSEGNEYAKIIAYRVPTDLKKMRPTSRKLAFLFEAEISEMTYSQVCSKIRDEYKTGIYRIQLRDASGSFIKQKTIMIEAPEKEKPEGVDGGSVIQAVSYALERQQEQMQQLFERFGNQNRSPFDFEKVIGYVVPIATALSALGISFKREPPKSTLEMAQELSVLKGLFSNDDGGEANIYSLIGKIAEGFGPALGAAIAHGRERGQVDEQGRFMPRSLPAPARNNSQKGNSKVSEQLESMRPQLQVILMQAQMQNSPETVANFMVDNIADSDEISDEQIEAILQALKQDDCFQQVVMVVPEFRDHAAWFSAWRMNMIRELEAIFENDGADDEADDNADNSTLTDEETARQDATESPAPSETARNHAPPDAASDVDGNTRRAGRNESHAEPHAADGADVEKEPATPATRAGNR